MQKQFVHIVFPRSLVLTAGAQYRISPWARMLGIVVVIVTLERSQRLRGAKTSRAHTNAKLSVVFAARTTRTLFDIDKVNVVSALRIQLGV